MRFDLFRRFIAKLIHDALPAALASLIGGFVLAHYGLGYPGALPSSSEPAAAPASPEMMGVLRDEHALIMNYLKAQIAKEKKDAELAATRSDPSAAADTEESASSAETSTVEPAHLAAAKPALPPRKASVAVAALPPPLVIADQEPVDGIKSALHRDDSLLAKTIGLKDHVIAATQRAASMIGGIPSWLGSVGDRFGGGGANPRPPAELVGTS